MNAIGKQPSRDISTGNEADGALSNISTALEELNRAVASAVEMGLTVEIKRSCRYHASAAWGDQMMPVVATRSS